MAAKKKSANKTNQKSTKKNTAKNRQNATSKSEYIALATIVLSLLLAVFVYIPSGFVGESVRGFVLGLFGIPAFLVPIYMLVLSVHRAINKKFSENISKYVFTAIGIVILAGIFHLFSNVDKLNPLMLSSMAEYYDYGALGAGGGIFGGILTDMLRCSVGSIASGIILFAVMLVIVMILTKWSPVKALLRVIFTAYLNAKKANEEIYHEAENAVKKQEKKEVKKHTEFKNFSDADVVRKEVLAAGDAKAKENEVLVEAKPYDDENYIPPSLLNVPADETTIDDIEKIIENVLPKTEAQLDFEEEKATEDEMPQNQEIAEINPVKFDGNDVDHNTAREIAQDEAPPWDEEEAQKSEENQDKEEDEFGEIVERIPYTFPSVDLLDEKNSNADNEASRTELRETAEKLISTLKSFNVEAKLLNVSKGPSVTRFELKPGEGVKVSKFVGLSDDIALRLAASGVRIEAPIPNKEAIGIEIPNKVIDMVKIRDVIDSEEFKSFDSDMAFAVGKDITGKNVVYDLSKMPHVLIAGQTGSGKSVCINTLIASIIYKADPNDVKLLMVDPKVVELGIYNGIPHLLIPVVTDPRRASGALYWAVQEMIRRYTMFADANVRDIKGYNRMIKEMGKDNTMAHIVIIIDELADLMMVAPNEVEDSICRLAQMARAAGMHLVIATQRPSVDVITGIIKANIPSRIAFSVASQIDSRTILDQGGAEKLLGRGDMLFYPAGSSKPQRLQGAFISDKEVERVVEFIKNQSHVKYDEDIIEKIDNGKPVNITDKGGDGEDDEMLSKAIAIAVEAGKISATFLQRKLKVGFARAARIVDQMEERGIVGPQEGSKPREVLISKEDFFEMSMK